MTIFRAKKAHPDQAPGFHDVEGWRLFLARVQTNPSPPPSANGTLPPAVVATNGVPGTGKSSHERYIDARARKTESAASILAIQLAATQRDMIPRAEVEAAFVTVTNLVKARFQRLVNDAPSFLLGLSAPEIHEVLGEKVRNVLNGIAMDPDFYKPRKISPKKPL